MLRAIFITAILIPGFIAGLFHPFNALLLYVWYGVFHPEAWVFFNITAYRPSLFIGALVVIRSVLAGVLPTLGHPLAVLMLLFGMSAVFSQIGAFDHDIAWVGLDQLLRLIVVVLFAISLLSTPRRIVIYTAVLAGSLAFHTAKAGLGSLLGGGVRFAEGLGGTFNDNNSYALGAVLILPLLIAAGQNMPSRWLRLGFYAAVPLTAFTVVSLFSRGALLALGTTLACFALLQRRKLAWGTLIACSVGLALLFAPIPEGYFERIQTIPGVSAVKEIDASQGGDENVETSAAGRLYFWRVAMDMAQHNVFGVGLRNFQVAYDQYDTSGGRYGPARAVHSSHFQVLAEVGYLGFFIYEALFIYAAVLIWRIRRRAADAEQPAERRHLLFTTANAIGASMAGFIVGGSFLAVAFNEVTWFTFALLASLDRLPREHLVAESAPIRFTMPGSLPVPFHPGMPQAR